MRKKGEGLSRIKFLGKLQRFRSHQQFTLKIIRRSSKKRSQNENENERKEKQSLMACFGWKK
jgi:hypothetical protein